MSDTCIVCLGDLGESASDPLEPVPVPSLDTSALQDGHVIIDGDGDGDGLKAKSDGLVEEDPGEIAQLLPCGHILHNNCLKPWVERANSCPICRRNFNMVELSDRIGGISKLFLSYT